MGFFQIRSYKAPSVALNSGYLFNKFADIEIFRLIEKDSNTKHVKEWKKCYKRQYHTYIYRNADRALRQNGQKKETKEESPTSSDIKLLYNHLREIIKSSGDKLKYIEFDKLEWKTLASALLSFLTIFNRRRVGEIERFEIKDFNAKHSIYKHANYYETLSTAEKALFQNYKRISLEGKVVI